MPEPLDDGLSAASGLVALLERDRWAGSVLRGGLPQVPSRDALPTASAEYAYRLIVVRGAPDVLYICLRDSGGVWGWEACATG